MLPLLALLAQATYHVDAETGADTHPGTTSPWRSLARVNAAQKALRSGDRILFKAGQVFPGALTLDASGITYGRYGDGPAPELSGFIPVTEWKADGPGVWKAVVPAAAPLHAVSIDGRLRPLGRAPNEGYLSVDSHVGKVSITDAGLPAGDWTGAEVVLRKFRWVIDRSRVTKHAGNTLTYESTSAYDAVDGHGYFLQNHPRTLDVFGEWHFDPASRELRVFSGDSAPSRVRVSAANILVAAARCRDLRFEGLAFSGANQAAFVLDGAERVTLRGCEIRESGVDALRGARVRGLLLEDCRIEDTNNNGVTLVDGASECVLRRVTLRRTGLHPGMGVSGDGTYNAIVLLGGAGNLIEDFVVTDTGYLPVHFGGSRISVRRGFIQGFASVKDDAGGIYTWTGAKDRTPTVERSIVDNIILDGRGAPAGALGATKAYGLYLDDCASGVEVRNNTVARTDGGLFLHNARHCAIRGNTFFDNAVQLLMIHDDIGPEGEIRGIAFTENTLASRTPWQPVLSATSTQDDFSKFGTFERNVYARPSDQGLIALQGIRDRRPQAYDLEGRREVTGLDRTTRPAGVRVAPYTLVDAGPNLVANGSFSSDVKGVSWWSASGNAEVVWVDGRLHHRYKALSGKPQTSLMTVPSGPLEAGGRYLLKFSVLGSAPRGSAGVRLIDGAEPWGPLTETQEVKVDGTRREVALLFTAPSAKASSGIQWVFNEGDGTFWLDDVELRKSTVKDPDPGTYRLELNPSAQPRTLRLERAYVDVDGKPCPETLILGPWTSKLLILSK